MKSSDAHGHIINTKPKSRYNQIYPGCRTEGVRLRGIFLFVFRKIRLASFPSGCHWFRESMAASCGVRNLAVREFLKIQSIF